MNPRIAFLILCVVFVVENAQCATRNRVPADPDAIMFPRDSGEQIPTRGGIQNPRPKTGKDVKKTNQEVLNHVNTNQQGDALTLYQLYFFI